MWDYESSGTKKPYLKLTPAQRFELGKKAEEIGATSVMPYFTLIHSFAIKRANS